MLAGRGTHALSIIFAVLAASYAPVSRSELLVAGARPNIIVIMADDLDETLLETALDANLLPVIKQTFVDSGIRMDNSFVTNSVCCPSRATFLTGQYTHNHKVLTNKQPYAFPSFNDSSTLATWLDEAGYQTGFVGKYLNRYFGEKDVNGDGVITNDERRYVPPGWDYWQGLLDKTTYRMYNYKILNSQTNLVELYTDVYQTETLTAKAENFINLVSADEEPFFLWVSPLAPHAEDLPETVACTVDTNMTPVTIFTVRPAPAHAGLADGIALPKGASFNEANIDDKPNWLKTYTAGELLDATEVACVEAVFKDKLESLVAIDEMVAGVLDTLAETGELTNTVLIFTSDNGFLYGQHRLVQPAKSLAFEESIRAPLFIRDLSNNDAARGISLAALNNDLAPTFMDLAGTSAPPTVDGRSLLPALALPATTAWRKRFLIEHFFVSPIPTYSALRSFGGTPLSYVEYLSGGNPAGQWVGCKPGLCELYFIDADPLQLNSQHAAPGMQALISRLEQFSRAFRTCKDGLCKQLEDH